MSLMNLFVCILVSMLAIIVPHSSSSSSLTSIKQFCEKEVNNIESIYHHGDFLLLSHRNVDRTVRFYVYNWRTGALRSKSVSHDEIFAKLDDSELSRGEILFVSTFWVCSFVPACKEEARYHQFVVVTFASAQANLESIVCKDLDRYYQTRLYLVEPSDAPHFVPRTLLNHDGSDHEWIKKYRGVIEVTGNVAQGKTMAIRTDLKCPHGGKDSAGGYVSGFHIMDEIFVQTKTGSVREYPYGPEMTIGKFLNCDGHSPILYRPLHLIMTDSKVTLTISKGEHRYTPIPEEVEEEEEEVEELEKEEKEPEEAGTISWLLRMAFSAIILTLTGITAYVLGITVVIIAEKCAYWLAIACGYDV